MTKTPIEAQVEIIELDCDELTDFEALAMCTMRDPGFGTLASFPQSSPAQKADAKSGDAKTAAEVVELEGDDLEALGGLAMCALKDFSAPAGDTPAAAWKKFSGG